MIVVDSSALIAILLNEPEKQAFEDIIATSERNLISAVNVHETACVLRARHGPQAVTHLLRLLTEADVEIIAFDKAQMSVAMSAFDRYGKGVNAKARLNLCDCAAYALSKTVKAPLLFKGDDFPQTDIASCL
jgi:ribonuclease VapC